MKLFESCSIKNLSLRNRFVMPPMCTYMVPAHDGKVTHFHQAHYVAPAIGGAALIIIEATAVSPEGRISDNDLGLWNDEQIPGFSQLVEGIHEAGAKVALQLAHAGRKCMATDGIAEILAPSSLAYDDTYRTPREMNETDIERVLDDFKESARRANEAGIDALEIHAAHGYLINQFISPETNIRTDRFRDPSLFLSLVLDAVHQVWPKDKAIWVRVSATDYSLKGYDVNYLIKVLEKVRTKIDAVHVSSGGVVPIVPQAYPGYQVSFAKDLKEALMLPTIAVGMLSSPDLAEYVLQSGSADLVAVGRGLLRNPNWLLEAALPRQKEFLLQQPAYLQGGFPLR
ncbi:NADPH dehydrogenase [uncultured Sphaerochaeta sp.]|uniref:oxidoreductase n=1 Tax=uncultured Sphaerochaeta sp. TaxID=886478 RepID=UPI002A0A3A42|nr:NADPH dehydrogenase [uncultured Sphaerochaeta sp.]